jgi:hypothetical protein
MGATEQGKKLSDEDLGTLEKEQTRLEIEYQELGLDWRQRDKNVLDKLMGAGILFTILGVAAVTLPTTLAWLKIVLLLVGALFSIILCISVAKDILYRDGSEKLLIFLADKLKISESLRNLRCSDPKSAGVALPELDLGFLRKIKIQPENSSLKSIPKWLKVWLGKQPTFTWVLYFYMVSFCVFVISAIVILVTYK